MGVPTQPDATTREDLYPTRGREGRFLPRTDPVIWSDWHSAARLSRDQVERYDRDGYLVLNDLFQEAEVAVLQQAAEALRTDRRDTLDPETIIQEPDSGAMRTIFALHEQSPLFARPAADSRILDVVQFLLDDRVSIHQSRLNDKPGFRGQPFQWHSDFEIWHAEDGMPRMRALSASILLADNVHLNAPLMLVPGSPRTFVSVAGETPDGNYRNSLRRQETGVPTEDDLSTLMHRHGLVSAIGKAGTVILFDCNTMHGSTANMTAFRRGQRVLCL